MRPRAHSARLAFVFAASVAAFAATPHAQAAAPSPSDKPLAEGCGKLAESQQRNPQLGTMLDLALCHEAEGKTATAWAEFGVVSDQATRESDKARGDVARQHARDLERKLSRVRLVVTPAGSDETVKLDGRELAPSMWGTALPVDPGDHTFEASAAGKKTWTGTVRVAVGPTLADFNVPQLEADGTVPQAPAPPPAIVPDVQQVAPPASSAGAPPAPPTNGEPSGDSGRTIGLIMGAIGIVGVGVGSVFGIMAFSQNAKADDNCKLAGGKCTQAGVDAGNAAAADAAISTIGFGIGLVSLATGAYMFFASPHAPPPATARLEVTPMIGPAGEGVSFKGRW